MRNRLVLALGASLSVSTAAMAQPKDCRDVADPTARLACYDAVQPATPAARPTAAKSAEDPMIAQARERVRKLLRDPDSARFSNLKIKTGKDGTKGVCGEVNARNAMGGMTGPQTFTFSSAKGPRFLLVETGPQDPTSLGGLILSAMLKESLAAYENYCK